MHFTRSTQSITRDTSKKRYGWCRLYDDFYSHAKWRLVAQKVKQRMPRGTFHAASETGTNDFALVAIGMIVIACFNKTSKGRNRGYLGDLDFEEIAAGLNLTAEIVATAYQTLEETGWLHDDHIVDWLDRQPDHEDPTAADRQRNKRARAKAKRAFAMGRPSEADRLLASRVTPGQQLRPRAAVPELKLKPETSPEAKAENLRIARAWLLGPPGEDFGAASDIVAIQFGQLRTSGHETVLNWLQEIGGDLVTLAQIVDSADQTALNRDAFRAIIKQRIGEHVRTVERGPALPLGITAIAGGRRAG